MTEEQWLNEFDLATLFDFLVREDKIDLRQFRLFACAASRGFLEMLADPRSRRAVRVAEDFADGKASRKKLNAAWDAAYEAVDDKDNIKTWLLIATTAFKDWTVGELCDNAISELVCEHMDMAENPETADLLRDIVGNPFRPVEFFPEKLSDQSMMLAQSAYSVRRRSGKLDWLVRNALADSLEETGCAIASKGIDPAFVTVFRVGENHGVSFCKNVEGDPDADKNIPTVHSQLSREMAIKWAETYCGVRQWRPLKDKNQHIHDSICGHGHLPVQTYSLLEHLRSPGAYFRGFWSLDYVRGQIPK